MSKEEARQEAIDWQNEFSTRGNLSYAELAEKQAYFKMLAEEHGLTEEFEENGII